MKKKRLFFTVVALALTTATVTACDSTSPTQENMSTQIWCIIKRVRKYNPF